MADGEPLLVLSRAMILRLTDKLRKDLRITKVVRDVPVAATFLDDWTVTLLTYRIHVHVLPGESEEGREMIRFRNLLGHYPLLRKQYEVAKRHLVSEGVTDSVEYSQRKGEAVRRILDSTNESPTFW